METTKRTEREDIQKKIVQDICDMLKSADCTFSEAFGILDQAATILKNEMYHRYLVLLE